MTTFFPDAFWPPIDPNYKNRLKLGIYLASKHSVYICGICRDCEGTIEDNLFRIDQLSRFFADSNTFIYENDSKDSTKILVDEWSKKRYNTVFMSENLETEHEQDKSLLRRINMANARNKYLERAKMNRDIMIVLDLDLYGFSVEGILHSLSYFNSYSIFGSNSLIYKNNQRLFYDSWALRYKDSWDDLGNEPNTLVFNRGEKLLEVNSCFGGCAIYPIKCAEQSIYTSDDCDHVTFHKQLKQKGYRVYLNPSQITLYSESYYNNKNDFNSNTNT